jgi:IS4 transposase
MWNAVIERFERYAPASVMARLALEHALPAHWTNEVFEAHRQRQYPRELMFSSIVELMTLVTLGMRPSLHAAARQHEGLAVSLAALYDKVNRSEPAVLRGLVSGSAQRLMPVVAQWGGPVSLAGWQLRIVDGNHLTASDKRLKVLRGYRGAALPGHSLVVYDPDAGLVCDMVACEDAHESERVGVLPLIERAQCGQLWVADRHFCTHTILDSLARTGAHFVVREHAKHPRVAQQGDWSEPQRTDTGAVREQTIAVEGIHIPPARGGKKAVQSSASQSQPPETAGPATQPGAWRRIQITLDSPTEAGEHTIGLWTNLPMTVDAATLAQLYRRRWRIEGMFQRLESVLHSEIKSLGHPRAALLGFAVAVVAYNVLSLLQRAVEHAHRQQTPELEVSTYHLSVQVKSGYEGMLIAVPAEHWPSSASQDPQTLAQTLLRLAQRILPKQVATSKRGPKTIQPKGYVDAHVASAHVSTARLIKQAREAAVTP